LRDNEKIEITGRPGIFLVNFLQGFRRDFPLLLLFSFSFSLFFSFLMLDLNRPSLPSSLLFGAEIINRPVHYRFEWSAKDAAAAVFYHEKE